MLLWSNINFKKNQFSAQFWSSAPLKLSFFLSQFSVPGWKVLDTDLDDWWIERVGRLLDFWEEICVQTSAEFLSFQTSRYTVTGTIVNFTTEVSCVLCIIFMPDSSFWICLCSSVWSWSALTTFLSVICFLLHCKW